MTWLLITSLLLCLQIRFSTGLHTSENKYEIEDGYACTRYEDGPNAERFQGGVFSDSLKACAEECDYLRAQCMSLTYDPSGLCLLWEAESCPEKDYSGTMSHYIQVRNTPEGFLESHGLCTPDPDVILFSDQGMTYNECLQKCTSPHYNEKCVAFAFKYGKGICSIRNSKECAGGWYKEHTNWYMVKRVTYSN